MYQNAASDLFFFFLIQKLNKNELFKCNFRCLLFKKKKTNQNEMKKKEDKTKNSLCTIHIFGPQKTFISCLPAINSHLHIISQKFREKICINT